jgi:hypothetical protein
VRFSSLASFTARLEAAAPAHHQHMRPQRKQPFKQRPSHNLVYSIVPPNVLTNCQQFPGRVKQPRRVQSPRSSKDLLPGAQLLRQSAQHLRIDPEGRIRSAQAAHAHRFNGCFAADAAT